MATICFLDHTCTVVDVLSYKLLLMGLSVKICIFHAMQEFLNKNSFLCAFEEPKQLLFRVQSPPYHLSS